MDTSNKRNQLIKLTNVTTQEWDDFINLVRDPDNQDDVKRMAGLECAVVSLFYRKNRDLRLTTNIRVSEKTLKENQKNYY